ncbi:SRPBCC family protein [Haliscomenobacter hydrossis]|uniref:SRPBCC family protein n=1 Tax=Haliscomenobacter hydrossis TaxID=2350 RepID=UPI001C54E492|nr:SRPBCC family protein [Haliscomenobacter hydrossis]
MFDIRALPDLLRGRERTAEDRSVGVDQVARKGTGFMILAEKPGQEVVVGSVGQFWHLNIPFASVAPTDFRDFQEPGWGKLAWSISVEPYNEGSTIALELRTTATDEASWEKLNQYYQLIGLGSQPIRRSAMAHIVAELGKLKTPDEDEVVLPGDEHLPDARYSLNHKIDIEAPPALVWRYLMQLGCDRAGWYSIDALDHEGIPSTDHLMAGWETRQVGDKVSATMAIDNFYEVVAVEPEHYLLLGGEVDRIGGHFAMTWAFVLEPIGHDACRLYTRVRVEGTPKWKEWLLAGFYYPPVHALMERTQLKHIQKLAERDARARPAEIMLITQ